MPNLPEGYVPDPNHVHLPDGTILAAGSVTAAHSAWDPGMGPCIEAALIAATYAVLAEGHGVFATDLILARKQACLEHVLALREEGLSVPDIMALIEAGGPPWHAVP